jgi:hypothetical protein
MVGIPGVRCAEAIDDEAVADLPGALPRIAEATWWSLETGAAPGGVTANPAAGGQGEREAARCQLRGRLVRVVIRGIRRRRCVRRRPRRVPLHEPRHLVIRHRVLVEETHVAITCAPLGQWSRGHIRRRRARRRVEIRCGATEDAAVLAVLVAKVALAAFGAFVDRAVA